MFQTSRQRGALTSGVALGADGGAEGDANGEAGPHEEDGHFLNGRAHEYPKAKSIKNRAEKMYLSSGKAYISTKLDTWMTFEDFEKLTK